MLTHMVLVQKYGFRIAFTNIMHQRVIINAWIHNYNYF